MISSRAFFGALIAFFVISCAQAPAETQAVSQSAASNVEIRLTRGACYGFCPDYTVTINGAGQVNYEGRGHVAVVGARSASIAPADVARLVTRFDDIEFDQLRDSYRAPVSDLPTYTLTLTRNGHSKTILDRGGPGVGLPAAVRELYAEIDRVAGTAQWVLRDGQPVRDPPQP